MTPNTLTIYLHTFDEAMAGAWRAEFIATPEVHVVEGDILLGRADSVVSPANSFGYMDGGIDLAYRRFFGDALETNLRKRVREEFFGEMPVGQATIVPTNHDDIPYLIASPTMRIPDRVANTVNVYLAFRAALIAVLAHNKTAASPIRTLRSPALGTGIGAMPLVRAARQMHAAHTAVFGDPVWLRDPNAILVHHEELRTV